MGNLSEVNLPNQILSLAVAGGLVAFAFLVLRIVINGIKLIVSKTNANNFNQGEMLKKESEKGNSD